MGDGGKPSQGQRFLVICISSFIFSTQIRQMVQNTLFAIGENTPIEAESGSTDVAKKIINIRVLQNGGQTSKRYTK